jgi:transposase InsO family protein
MKYRFMERISSGFEVMKMGRVLGVSRSGYYAYLRRGLSPRREENERLVTRIREIWGARRRVYGSPRITAELRSEGVCCGKNRIARLMRENGIRSLMKRRFKVTTRSDHRLPLAEDLVGREFVTASINELWVSDITYIWTWEGWLYLAAVMDVHNREIVGWALRDRLAKELVVESLAKGLRARTPQAGLTFHSDRGGQYASSEVKRLLRMWHVRQSMSGRGSCFDNAVMESFFSSLKRELVHLETFHTKAQARRSVFAYIEIFYNRQRRHSSLNHKTPLEYYREATQA